MPVEVLGINGAAKAGDDFVVVDNEKEAKSLCEARIQENKFWHDHKGAKLNAIRTRTAIGRADVVVVRFGEKYKQWNAAFDAGYAAALGKALIIMHGSDHQHALKEVDGAALATVETADQVAAILDYVITGKLPAAS